MAASIAIGVIALATTAYSVTESQKSAQKAEDLQKDRDNKQKKLEDDAKANQSAMDEKAAKLQERNDAFAEARQRASDATGGRRQTILTSPIGLPGSAPTSGKTLIGS